MTHRTVRSAVAYGGPLTSVVVVTLLWPGLPGPPCGQQGLLSGVGAKTDPIGSPQGVTLVVRVHFYPLSNVREAPLHVSVSGGGRRTNDMPQNGSLETKICCFCIPPPENCVCKGPGRPSGGQSCTTLKRTQENLGVRRP